MGLPLPMPVHDIPCPRSSLTSLIPNICRRPHGRPTRRHVRKAGGVWSLHFGHKSLHFVQKSLLELRLSYSLIPMTQKDSTGSNVSRYALPNIASLKLRVSNRGSIYMKHNPLIASFSNSICMTPQVLVCL